MTGRTAGTKATGLGHPATRPSPGRLAHIRAVPGIGAYGCQTRVRPTSRS